ncbi:hypothetical protein V1511DRAFT_507093 [Dipodascopsis uninucleata]
MWSIEDIKSIPSFSTPESLDGYVNSSSSSAPSSPSHMTLDRKHMDSIHTTELLSHNVHRPLFSQKSDNSQGFTTPSTTANQNTMLHSYLQSKRQSGSPNNANVVGSINPQQVFAWMNSVSGKCRDSYHTGAEFKNFAVMDSLSKTASVRINSQASQTSTRGRRSSRQKNYENMKDLIPPPPKSLSYMKLEYMYSVFQADDDKMMDVAEDLYVMYNPVSMSFNNSAIYSAYNQRPVEFEHATWNDWIKIKNGVAKSGSSKYKD